MVVFTQNGNNYINNNPAEEHNQNYHLLNSGGDYLFIKVPMGFINDNCVNAKVYLPRARKSFKKKYIQGLKDNFLKKKGPKILLHSDENNTRISNVIEKITIDEEKIDIHRNIEIGLVIFENVDRFVYSSYSTQIFLNWLCPLLKKNIRLLFHFSNPLSKHIQVIKEQTDAYVLQLGPSLLRYNTQLQKASLEYFNTQRPDEEKKLLDKYNIDRSFFYKSMTKPETLPLNSGNIDKYYKNARSLLNKIDEKILFNKWQYYFLINLLFKLYNLSINPSKYKELFYDHTTGHRHYHIPEIIKKIKENISNEETPNKEYLEDLISEIYCLYLELKECKRYGENDTYTRIAKDYQILQLLKQNIGRENDKNNIVLATYSSIEAKILKNETKKLGFENGFDIEYIERLSRKSFDRTKSILLLPGPLRLKYISELLQPYYKIVMVTYDGRNHEIACEQIKLAYAYSQQEEDKAMKYLEEIYSDLGIKKNGLFKDYYNRKSEPKEEENVHVPIEKGPMATKEDTLLDRIKKLLSTRKSPISEDILQEEIKISQIEQKIIEFEQEEDACMIAEADEYYMVILESVDGTTKITRNLPINNTYLYLKNISDDVQEGYPSELEIDDYIVLLGNDERKNLLDTIIEVYGLEDAINKRLLTMWKDKLRNFMEKQCLSCHQTHNKFIETGGSISSSEFSNWAKGRVIAPDDSKHLFILGKMMDDDELIENYELISQEAEELRNVHKITGRKIRKIVKEILRGELPHSELSYEESLLYEKVQNNIYRIIDIKKVTRKEVELNENSSN